MVFVAGSATGAGACAYENSGIPKKNNPEATVNPEVCNFGLGPSFN
jgi:hypothetical protein